MLAVRRSMFTTFTLPNRRITTLGEGILDVDVKTVKLPPQPGVRESLVPYIGRMEPFLITSTGGESGELVGALMLRRRRPNQWLRVSTAGPGKNEPLQDGPPQYAAAEDRRDNRARLKHIWLQQTKLRTVLVFS
jgi:hypothetical protein